MFIGGDGANGINGHDGYISEIDNNKIINEYKKIKKGLRCADFASNDCVYPCGCSFNSIEVENYFKENYPYYDSHFKQDSDDYYIFRVNGEEGEEGGLGGKGGVGGEAGLPGTMILINYNELNKRIQRNQSEYCSECRGKNGLNGKNGQKGADGHNYTEIFKIKRGFGLVYGDELEHIRTNISYPINDYITESIEENLETFNPKKPTRSPLSLYKLVNDYLKFSMSHKEKNLNKNFLLKILSEEYFEADLKEIISRAKILVDFDSEFDLNNLKSEIKKMIENKNTSDNERQVLNHLQVYLLSVIMKKNSLHSPHLVLDLREYIRSIIDKIEKKDELEKQNMINNYISAYETNLKESISDLTDSINTINQSIENIEIKIFNEMAVLAKKIVDEKHELISKSNNLTSERKKLENKLLIGQILGSLKIFAGCISLLGPKGALVGGLAQIGLESVSSFFYKENSSQFILKKLNNSNKYKLYQNSSINEMIKNLKKREKLDLEEINLIEEEINEVNNQYEDLYKIKAHIYFFFSNITEFRINNLKTNEMSSLERLEITSKYKSIRSHILNMLNNREYSKEIELYLDRLENAIGILFEIYASIEKYKNHEEFSRLQMAIVKNRVSLENDYDEIINELKIGISSNLIHERYRIALDAYKYWSFPNSCFGNITQHEIKESNDTNVYKTHLEALLASLSDNKILIDINKANNVHKLDFIDDDAFYRWSSNEYPFEIHNLLSGKQIQLFANVKNSNKDAVKFKSLYMQVYVEPRDGEINENLQNLLNHFRVKLVYAGDSFNKLNNKIYSLGFSHYGTILKLELVYHYGCKMGKECVNSNIMFQMLSDNRAFLSPFTYWDVKLLPLNNKSSLETFRKIEAVVSNNEVFVSLVGNGEYVEYDKYMPSMDCLKNIQKEEI